MGWDRVSLADAMIARMTREEVEDLCFRLRVDDENLDSRTKNSLVRGLIKYMEQRGQFDRLTRELAAMRPDLQPPAPTSIQIYPTNKAVLSSRPLPSEPGPALGDRLTDADVVTMVYVPPGTFTMGGTVRDNEKPPHEVIIAQGFWLDLTPVTNAMYARFIKAWGYRKPELWTPSGWDWVQTNKKRGPKDYKGFTEPKQPRVGVTWFEAYAYCRWRGGRLPTEAEWEWAARGPENREYPWGEDFDPSRVIFSFNSGGRMAVVSAQSRREGASWVGALDMSGNVWEWVSSLNKSYPYDGTDGRESLEDDRWAHVLRGGSWNFGNEYDLRAACRYGGYPSHVDSDLGFRCARSS